jgi:signal transduction histidine kinase
MESRFTQSFLLELVEKLLQTKSKKAALSIISSHLRFIVNLECMTLLLEESDTHYQIYAPVVSKKIPKDMPCDLINKTPVDIEKHFDASETVLSEKILASEAFKHFPQYFNQVTSWKVFPVTSGQKHFGYAFIGNNTSSNQTEIQSLRSVFEHLAFTLLRIDQQEKLERVNREVSKNNELLRLQQDNLEQANRALIGTLEEINEAQEELLEVQKQASLGKVVRGIAHQINTPAGVCVTASSNIEAISHQLLTDLEKQKLTQKDFVNGITHIREVAKLLLQNSQKVTDLVGKFKHAAVDEWHETATEFSLNKLLHEAKRQSDFRNEISSNIIIECAHDVLMFGFAAALRESLVLLMDNAIHFALLTPKDKATARVQKKGNRVVITLVDTGKGMTDEQCQKLFEPFYTSHKSNNHIGLGAHIAHNLITHKCRGSIKLISEPLQPTQIDIEIPQTYHQ